MICYVSFDTHEWNISHSFEFKTHLFQHFSELKIRDCLKFEMPFFTLRKSPKRNFPRTTSDLTKTPVNYTNVICFQEILSWKSHFKCRVRHKLEGVLNSNSYGSLQDSHEYKVWRGLHKYWLCNFKRAEFSCRHDEFIYKQNNDGRSENTDDSFPCYVPLYYSSLY